MKNFEFIELDMSAKHLDYTKRLREDRMGMRQLGGRAYSTRDLHDILGITDDYEDWILECDEMFKMESMRDICFPFSCARGYDYVLSRDMTIKVCEYHLRTWPDMTERDVQYFISEMFDSCVVQVTYKFGGPNGTEIIYLNN